MENVAGQIYSNPEILFRNAPTPEQKFRALASAFADSYSWRQEESDLLASLTTRIRILEAEIRALKAGE